MNRSLTNIVKTYKHKGPWLMGWGEHLSAEMNAAMVEKFLPWLLFVEKVLTSLIPVLLPVEADRSGTKCTCGTEPGRVPEVV